MAVITIVPGELITAEMLMSKRLITLNDGDTMRHAAALFLDKDISGAAVVDREEKAVGVLSKTDIVHYEREHALDSDDVERESLRALGTLETIARRSGFHRESEEDRVKNWMTPKVFCVGRQATLAAVLRELARRRVHRLFVRDERSARLVGIITTFDIMRFLAKALLVDAGRSRKRR